MHGLVIDNIAQFYAVIDNYYFYAVIDNYQQELKSICGS